MGSSTVRAGPARGGSGAFRPAGALLPAPAGLWRGRARRSGHRQPHGPTGAVAVQFHRRGDVARADHAQDRDRQVRAQCQGARQGALARPALVLPAAAARSPAPSRRDGMMLPPPRPPRPHLTEALSKRHPEGASVASLRCVHFQSERPFTFAGIRMIDRTPTRQAERRQIGNRSRSCISTARN